MKALHLFRLFFLLCMDFSYMGKTGKDIWNLWNIQKENKFNQLTIQMNQIDIFSMVFPMLNTITLSSSKIHNFKHNSYL